MESSQCLPVSLHPLKSQTWYCCITDQAGAVLLPLILIFPLFMGIDGVMYAGPIADAAAAVVAIFYALRELNIMKILEKKAV